MPRPSPSDDILDTLISQLKSGMMLADAAALAGFSVSCLIGHLKARRNWRTSEQVKRPAHNRKQFDCDAAIAAYVAGESVKSISCRLGISRACITDRFKQAGVNLRGASEAGDIVWANLTPAQRLKQTQAAHNAVRGKPIPHIHRLANSKARQFNEGWNGIFEKELCEALTASGLDFIPQAALDIYNLDALVGGRVAVEVSTKPIGRYRDGYGLARLKKIADAGLHLYYIHTKSVEAGMACMSDIIADIKQLNGLPPVPRQNRVIRCSTKLFTRVRNERGQLVAVPAPISHEYVIVEVDWLP